MTRAFFALVAFVVVAATAHAQSFSVSPSFGISQMYDDNLFYQPAGEGDTITRVSSRLDARYGSERQTLSARYVLDADRFNDHPALTTVHARQDAAFEERFHTTRRLSLNGAAAFTETTTPTELNLATALTPGRARAQRLTLNPSATYQLGALTHVTFGYLATHDRMLAVSLLSQTATASVEHHASPRDSFRWEFSYQDHLFDAVVRQTSQALTGEWTHELTRATSLSLRGGPRLTGGALSPEAAASLNHKMRIGDVALGYAHTQTTIIGLVGIADTHSLTARVSGELRSGLQLRVEPALLRTTQTDLASTVYRVSLGGMQPLGRRLALEASYDMNLQHGNIYAAQSVETIGRNVVMVKLVAATREPERR